METTTPPLTAAGGLLRVTAMVVIVVALPLFAVTSCVRWVALDQGFYVDEFAKYRVGLTTGLPDAELEQVAQAFVAYFQSSPGPLDVVVTARAGREPLLSAKEIQHMEDVQVLMHRVVQVWVGSIIAMLVAAFALFATEPATGSRALMRAGALGGGATVLIIGSIGVLALFDFRQLFLQFHFITFSNDLWLLDPARDRLIQLFPQGFFFDSAIRLAGSALALGVGVLVASATALHLT